MFLSKYQKFKLSGQKIYVDHNILYVFTQKIQQEELDSMLKDKINYIIALDLVEIG